MRIIFLCGSLEPGYDGVGDYSRRLACELIEKGHEVAVLALSDRHIKVKIDDIQVSEGKKLPVLRLPFNLNSKSRFKIAREWIDNFEPEWLSLQFVPYSYQSKGLPFGLQRHLSEMGNGRKWHIMFHELWIGMGIDSSLKDIVLGWVQSRIITSLISKIKPRVIHTQCKLYQKQLFQLGFQSEFLPLFSNISFIEKDILNESGLESKTNKAIQLVNFGTIQAKTNIVSFSKDVAQYAKQNNVDISLTLIGRSGKEQRSWIEEWEGNGLQIKVLGELSTERLSEILTNASVGLITTPILQIEKSGSYAAMKEHGLPVICVSQTWKPRGVNGCEIEPKVIEYLPGNIKECLDREKSHAIKNKLTEIGKKLIDSFNEFNAIF